MKPQILHAVTCPHTGRTQISSYNGGALGIYSSRRRAIERRRRMDEGCYMPGRDSYRARTGERHRVVKFDVPRV